MTAQVKVRSAQSQQPDVAAIHDHCIPPSTSPPEVLTPTLDAALAAAGDVVSAAAIVCDHLDVTWELLPSVYLKRDGLLRCVAQRGYWQVLDGIPPGVGVLSSAVEGAQWVFEPNVDEVEEFLEAASGLVAEIAAPIWVHGRVIGGLNVESTSSIGADAAAEVERCARLLGARLAEIGMEQPDTALARFARSSKQLAGLSGVTEIRQAVVKMACDVADMNSAFLAQRDSGGRLTVDASVGPMTESFDALPASDLEQLEAVVSRVSSCYTAGDVTGRAVPGTENLRAGGAVDIVVVPLATTGRRDGVLVVGDTTHRSLSTDDIEPLELLATEAGRCLDLASTVAELRWRAQRDPLTELKNHSAFYDALERTPRPFALALMDLDGFKAVNDSEGHLVGDQLLRDVAVELQHSLDGTGTPYRVGGDEFAVILPDTGIMAAVQLVRQLRSRVCEVLRPQGAAISIGLTIATTADLGHGAVQRADDLLYRAKRDGFGVCPG